MDFAAHAGEREAAGLQVAREGDQRRGERAVRRPPAPRANRPMPSRGFCTRPGSGRRQLDAWMRVTAALVRALTAPRSNHTGCVVALLVERLDRLALLAAREGAVGLRQHVAQLLGKRAVGRIERRERIGRRRRLGRRRRSPSSRPARWSGGAAGPGRRFRPGQWCPQARVRRFPGSPEGRGIRRGWRRERRRLRHRDGRIRAPPGSGCWLERWTLGLPVQP